MMLFDAIAESAESCAITSGKKKTQFEAGFSSFLKNTRSGALRGFHIQTRDKQPNQ